MRHRLMMAVSVLALILGACGGGGAATDATEAVTQTTEQQAPPTTAETAPDPTTTTTEAMTETTAASSSGGTELVISAVDSEGFSTTQLEAKAGEITLTFENKDPGDEPHNIRILNDGNDFATELASGPDTQTITFTINTPGEYKYVCDTHVTAMTGTLVVTP